jgi:hypothetical protein
MYSVPRKVLSMLVLGGMGFCLFSQEALKSTEEDYYDFLALQGLIERPTLNYRTLSDSVWELSDDAAASDGNVWKNNNLGTVPVVNDNIKWRIYGPDWFNSYNTAAPYGQNDGALWQGKGYNTSLTAGARLEAYGFELTIKPQICFSQNLDYDYITPNYSGSMYEGKASVYGDYGIASVDAPQRFGDTPFFTFDWGDTEIRYTWKTLTLGFGTQAIWIGPAQLNPIISSNNAASYPKFDIGIRKQSIYMPWTGWYLGDIEFRGWWGYLSESDYFDNDSSNDHNLITGMSAAWAPPFFKGLTLGVDRTMLSKWINMSSYSLFGIYDALNLTSGGTDESDQRISFTADYLFTKIGLDLYLEWARNDYSPSLDYIINYPFHTQAYTVGLRKVYKISNNWKAEILLEITNLESSRDYDNVTGETGRSTSFYSHHIITQGYTNDGQWLGAGIGSGGNSQYLGCKIYYTKGYINCFIQRRNPNMDYTWFIDADSNDSVEESIRSMLDFGISGLYFITENFSSTLKCVIIDDRNPMNDSNADPSERYNFYTAVTLKYTW